VLVGSQPLEVQIRTDDMHRVAELGAAAHWAYKDTDASLPWLQIIREWHAQVDSSSVFMQLVRNELLGTRVFVFAPRGRILNLAKGATLADAVAHVVSEESQSDRRGALAYVNGQREDAEYELRNGDIVSFAPPVDRAAEMPIVVEHTAVAPSNWTLCSRCMPVPGDAVFGAAYRHAARGTVHRSDCDCDALRRELQRPGARLVDGAALAMNDDDASAVSRALARDRAVRGADGEIVGFQSSIVVFCRDRTRMLLDVSLAVSAVNIVDVMSETVWNSNLQPDFCAYATVSTQALWLCFENSTRAIDSSKNQPNRLRFDRAREF
jgi:molybdopterin converting factor small subunit